MASGSMPRASLHLQAQEGRNTSAQTQKEGECRGCDYTGLPGLRPALTTRDSHHRLVVSRPVVSQDPAQTRIDLGGAQRCCRRLRWSTGRAVLIASGFLNHVWQ